MSGGSGFVHRLALALVGREITDAIAPPRDATSRDRADERLLEALIKEYELTFNALEQSAGRSVQISTAIVTTLGAALSVIPQIRVQEHFPIILVLPAFFIVMFGILLFELSSTHADIWGCRMLARRINGLLPDTAMIRFEPSFPSASAFSMSRGLRPVQILQSIMIGGPFFLLFTLLAVLWSVLQEQCGKGAPDAPACISLGNGLFYCGDGGGPGGPPAQCPALAPSVFLLWVPVVLAEIALIWGPVVQIPSRFRAFFGANPEGPFPPRTALARPPHRPLRTRLRSAARAGFFWFMPRPWDFVCKWPCFWIGFTTIWVAYGISTSQVDRINTFVAPLLGVDSWAGDSVPIHAILLLALAYFLIEEVGFQQAKFLIDDAQSGDVKRDQTLLQNRGWRAVSAGIIRPRQALVYGIIRALASLVLAWLLGGGLFLGALLLSTVHQGVYVFWLKPRAKTAPQLILFWISLNLAPRLLAGFVAASDSAWGSWVAAIVLATFITSSLGGMAAQWKMEAQHHGPDVRGQSAYMLEHGEQWQRVGFAAAVLIPTITGIIHVATATGHPVDPWACLTDRSCPPFGLSASDGILLLPGVTLGPAVLCLAALALILSWALFGRTSPKLSQSVLHQKPPLLGLTAVACLLLWILAATLGSVTIWWGMLMLMQLWLLLHFRGLRYTEFAVGGMAARRKGEG